MLHQFLLYVFKYTTYKSQIVIQKRADYHYIYVTLPFQPLIPLWHEPILPALVFPEILTHRISPQVFLLFQGREKNLFLQSFTTHDSRINVGN